MTIRNMSTYFPLFQVSTLGWSITQFAIIQPSCSMLQCSTFAGSITIFSHLIFIFDGGTIILMVKPSCSPVNSPSLLVEPSFFWWNPWFLLLNSSPLPRISLTRPLHRKSCRSSGGNSGGPAANAAEPEPSPPWWPAGGRRREGMGSTCARHLGRCGFDGEILIFDVCWILFGNPVEFEVVFLKRWWCFLQSRTAKVDN